VNEPDKRSSLRLGGHAEVPRTDWRRPGAWPRRISSISTNDPNHSRESARVRPSTGHVALVKRSRGAQWYARLRVGRAGGRQIQRWFGPAWTERGRAPAGHYTRKLAEAELRRMLTDLDRGTSAMSAKSEATFADAAAEFLRFVAETRRRESSTISEYRGVIRGSLLPRWGDRDVATHYLG
jgi:hypothetical protein